MNTMNVKMGGNAPSAKRPKLGGGPARPGTIYTGRAVGGGSTIPHKKHGSLVKGKSTRL